VILSSNDETKNMDKETGLVEAVLYLESAPISIETIARATQLEDVVVEEALGILRQRYAAADCGIEILQMAGGYMLSPKKEFWEQLKERYGRKNEARLSRAAMETLSIIAYSQPVTRSEIENIRGVNADNMIRLLADKGLVKECGKKDAPGRPVQYGTTKEFLEFFRINSIADLPKLSEEEAERFELAN
jgi:segregation and condensation protein B